MRLLLAGVLALLVACSPAAGPPPDATTVPADGPIRGVLPDGTVYDVILEPPAHETVTSVTAGVAEGGKVTEVDFERSGDRWAAHPVLEVTTHLGLPTVDLPPSLAWADDDRVPMQVLYETFAVRRGCGADAVACNPTQAVQAVPREGWQGKDATVVSYALRRPDHPAYLDPGPLPGRSEPAVLWTGEEVLVWGGSGPPHTDGAAYDPSDGTWRMLPPPPIEEAQPARAVWAGSQMMVVSAEATVAYHPDDDSWSRVADGTAPPSDPARIAWTGDEVVTWTEEGPRALREGTWVELGDPGLAAGVFRSDGGRLYAVGAGTCDERAVRGWDGERWVPVAPPPGDGERCPQPQQTAVVGGQPVTWLDGDHPTQVYDGTAWEEIDPVPLEAIEDPSGPLRIGERFLVARGSAGAIFDPATLTWRSVDLPGHGTDATMVWTGEEVLMWNRCCYEPDDVDAWRWSPPRGD